MIGHKHCQEKIEISLNSLQVQVLRLFTVYQLGKTLLVMLVAKITGDNHLSQKQSASKNVVLLAQGAVILRQ